MRRAAIGLLLVNLCLLVAFFATPVSAQRPVPHAFYGTVELDGEPAAVGVEVEARGEGVLTGVQGNPISVTEAGKYGGPRPLDPRLIVQGDLASGTPIEFYVDGTRAECYDPQTGEWVDTYPFDSDETTELNLRPASGPTATPTSTATAGPSPTPTSTSTPGPSPTPTSTATVGPSPTPTVTPLPTTPGGPSPTPTSTPTAGPSPTPTSTPTGPSPTPTSTPEGFTPSPTLIPTSTPEGFTPSPTLIPTSTPEGFTPSPTAISPSTPKGAAPTITPSSVPETPPAETGRGGSMLLPAAIGLAGLAVIALAVAGRKLWRRAR